MTPGVCFFGGKGKPQRTIIASNLGVPVFGGKGRPERKTILFGGTLKKRDEPPRSQSEHFANYSKPETNSKFSQFPLEFARTPMYAAFVVFKHLLWAPAEAGCQACGQNTRSLVSLKQGLAVSIILAPGTRLAKIGPRKTNSQGMSQSSTFFFLTFRFVATLPSQWLEDFRDFYLYVLHDDFWFPTLGSLPGSAEHPSHHQGSGHDQLWSNMGTPQGQKGGFGREPAP